MKVAKTLTIIVLVIAVSFGWISFFLTKTNDATADNNVIEIADKYVSDGLYQRAILKYKEALSYNYSYSTVVKMLNAYELRYAENSNIRSEYVDALNSAVNSFPTDAGFVSDLIEFYIQQGDYGSAYKKLTFAFSNGLSDESLYKKKQELRYSYSMDPSAYNVFLSLSDNSYTVQTGDGWFAVDAQGETVSGKSPYMSSSNGGIRAYENEKDTRLINSDGLVLGIFDSKPQNAGLFSDGLIPACIDDKYSYYDAFADKIIGDYEYAGAFQNGKAAVIIDGKWYLIDNTGKCISEAFADIVVDGNGRHLNGNVMIAAVEEGKYMMYDTDGKLLNEFSAAQMDICMSNGYIAFEKDGKWGFVNTSGNVVIDPMYENAKSFSNGLAAICVDGKWGFVDPSNEIVIKCQYEDADYFNSYGSCMVCIAQPEESDNPDVEPTVKEVWKLLKLNLGIQGE